MTLKAETLRALAKTVKDAAEFIGNQTHTATGQRIYERLRAVPEILALLEADKDERVAALEAENGRMREALEYAHMGLGRIHNSLMTNGPKQAAGEMTAHFLEKARRALGKDQA